jgi:hypothetical protein
MMRRISIVFLIGVVTLVLSASASVAPGENGEVIKAELQGVLHFQEGRGYFIAVKSKVNAGEENRVWLWISENKVLVRQLSELLEKRVIARGELEQMPDKVGASVPPHGMYLTNLQSIELVR